MYKRHYCRALKNSAKLREAIWEELNLSGSKFKDWVLQPQEFVKNKKKEFSEFVLKKLEAGREIEPFILKFAEKKLSDLYEFKVDKKTYVSETFPNKVYANVDAFGYDKQTGEMVIVEIKNTTNSDIDSMVATYYFQLLFYAWFFNTKKALFINLVNGWDLKWILVEFTDSEIEKVWNSVEKFFDFFYTNQIPESSGKSEFTEINDETLTQALKKFIEINEKTKLLNNELKRCKETVRNYLKTNDIKDNIISNNCSFKLTTQTRKNLSKEKLAHFLVADFRIHSEKVDELLEKATETSEIEILKLAMIGDSNE